MTTISRSPGSAGQVGEREAEHGLQEASRPLRTASLSCPVPSSLKKYLEQDGLQTIVLGKNSASLECGFEKRPASVKVTEPVEKITLPQGVPSEMFGIKKTRASACS